MCHVSEWTRHAHSTRNCCDGLWPPLKRRVHAHNVPFVSHFEKSKEKKNRPQKETRKCMPVPKRTELPIWIGSKRTEYTKQLKCVRVRTFFVCEIASATARANESDLWESRAVGTFLRSAVRTNVHVMIYWVCECELWAILAGNLSLAPSDSSFVGRPSFVHLLKNTIILFGPDF